MNIIYRKRFLKGFRKLQPRHQKAVKDALNLFRHDPFHSDLKNHSLKGKMRGKRAISAAFNLRIIFKEERNYVTVLLLKVGSHDEVY